VSEVPRITVDILLGFAAVSCWLGVIGMVRMRDAYQSLHYLALPAVIGMSAIFIAVWVETGWTQATWKSLIILVILVASNSVGTHAAARAFRAREKGHWDPDPHDPEIEFLGERPAQ
jgi:monovalent cation/proton antiporter MnhG/PhaG subunit